MNNYCVYILYEKDAYEIPSLFMPETALVRPFMDLLCNPNPSTISGLSSLHRSVCTERTSVSAHADWPRDAASRQVDHRAVQRAGSTPCMSILKVLGHVNGRRLVFGCLHRRARPASL